ncbi:MAG: non-homologous end joining protein Ku [Thiobacillus sp.]
MPAASSKRSLWKGAISFGLVHIPIALHTATTEQGLNFDWLDKRSMDPVGYKRINKKTGQEIDKENIVKGIEYEDGEYVILSPEEIEAAYPKTTQTIEIEAFVPVDDIELIYLERPYYISPINKGAKVYALLREILQKNKKAAIARVVIMTKQHLAALIPSGPMLVLYLLRWGDEIRSYEELAVPPKGIEAAGLTDKEIQMGELLVEDMSAEWNPDAYQDSFKQRILDLVEQKAKAGETASVTPVEPKESESATSATIYDLTELLQRSLNKGSPEKKAPAKSTPAKSSKSAPKTKPAKAAVKPAAKKKAA